MPLHEGRQGAPRGQREEAVAQVLRTALSPKGHHRHHRVHAGHPRQDAEESHRAPGARVEGEDQPPGCRQGAGAGGPRAHRLHARPRRLHGPPLQGAGRQGLPRALGQEPRRVHQLERVCRLLPRHLRRLGRLSGLAPLGLEILPPRVGLLRRLRAEGAPHGEQLLAHSVRRARARGGAIDEKPAARGGERRARRRPRAHPRATRGGRRDRPEVRGEPSVGGSRGRDGRVASGIGQSPLRGDGEHVGDGTRRSSGRRHDSVRR